MNTNVNLSRITYRPARELEGGYPPEFKWTPSDQLGPVQRGRFDNTRADIVANDLQGFYRHRISPRLLVEGDYRLQVINFDGIGAQTCCRKQSFLERLTQTCELNCDS